MSRPLFIYLATLTVIGFTSLIMLSAERTAQAEQVSKHYATCVTD